jgi:hypothetical protein
MNVTAQPRIFISYSHKAAYRRVRLGTEFANRGSEWVSARLLQVYLAARPEDVDNVLSIDEWLFTGTAAARERFPQPAGMTVVALRAWRPEALPDHLGDAATALAWLGAVESCEPGGFAVATWRLAMAGTVGAASAAADAWLRAAHLAFTLRREPLRPGPCGATQAHCLGPELPPHERRRRTRHHPASQGRRTGLGHGARARRWHGRGHLRGVYLRRAGGRVSIGTADKKAWRRGQAPKGGFELQTRARPLIVRRTI